LPRSHARSPCAEASPTTEARSSHTVQYSFMSFASSSCAWASCTLMSAPPVGEVGVHSAPHPGVIQFSGGEGLLRRRPPRSRCSSGHRRPPRSTHARGRRSRRWSRRSSQTSSSRRRGTARTSPDLTRHRSPTPRTRARWWVAARWWSHGRTLRWWWC
jgi:hypothetical protein